MVWTITKNLRRGNARNWPGLIVMDEDAKPYGAIWAQEYFESLHKSNPWRLLTYRFRPGMRREMEILGHEIEVQAAVDYYRRDEAKYRAREAEDMTKYADFKDADMGKRAIEKEMILKRVEARRFVDDNRDEIEGAIRAHGGNVRVLQGR